MNGAHKTGRPSQWSDPHQATRYRQSNALPAGDEELKVDGIRGWGRISSNVFTSSFSNDAFEQYTIPDDMWVTSCAMGDQPGGAGDIVSNGMTALVVALCDAEIIKHKNSMDPQPPEDEYLKCAKYYGSSRMRNVFCRLMVKARLTGQPLNITQLTKEMMCTRKIVKEIVNDSLAEGWIESNTEGGTKYLRGSHFLTAGFFSYVRWASQNWAAFARCLSDLTSVLRVSRYLEKMNSNSTLNE